jgi:hypothetical protein
MMKEPIRLRFTAAKPGHIILHVVEASKGGGSIKITVNGSPLFAQRWLEAAANTGLNVNMSAPFPAGQNEVVIENPAADWVQIDSITVEGIGSGVSAACLRTDRYALARLTWNSGFGPDPKTVSIPGLTDGTYEMRQFDLDTGSGKTTRIRVSRGALRAYAPVGRDEVFKLTFQD